MPKAQTLRPISVAITPDRKEGHWVAFYQVGDRPNGTADRRKRSSTMCSRCKVDPSNGPPSEPSKLGCPCYERCVQKIRELEDAKAAGAIERPGKVPTVMEWFTHWLTDIAPIMPSASKEEPLRPLTIEGYWSKCRQWIFPHLRDIRLDVLDASDLLRMYRAMYKAGLKASSVRACHSVMSRGLELARRHKKVSQNVAKDMDNPGTPPKKKRDALSEEQLLKVRAIIAADDDALRWEVGLAIGPRQGEALGIRWSYLDLDTGVVDISWQIQRRPWKHGCTNPKACSDHRAALVCPAGPRHDRYHRKACPKGPTPCPRNCAGHADRCPNRHGGGIVFCRPKTYRDADDQHLVALPANLLPRLRVHHARQAAIRLEAGICESSECVAATSTRARCIRWHDHDLIFCQSTGRPLEPRKDLERWKKVLKRSGLVGVGTHAMRRTAATIMRKRGNDLDTVQEVLGHSSPQTTRGYTDVSAVLAIAAAESMNDLFGPATDLATEREKRRPKGAAR